MHSIETPVFATEASADNGLLATQAEATSALVGNRKQMPKRKSQVGRRTGAQRTAAIRILIRPGSTLQRGNHLEPFPTGNTNGIVYATYAPTDARARLLEHLITAESNLLRSLSSHSASYEPEPVIVQRAVSFDSGPPA